MGLSRLRLSIWCMYLRLFWPRGACFLPSVLCVFGRSGPFSRSVSQPGNSSAKPTNDQHSTGHKANPTLAGGNLSAQTPRKKPLGKTCSTSALAPTTAPTSFPKTPACMARGVSESEAHQLGQGPSRRNPLLSLLPPRSLFFSRGVVCFSLFLG